MQASLCVRHALFNRFGQRSFKKAYASCPHLTSFIFFVLQFYRLQAQTLLNATPQRGKMHPFIKIDITFEPMVGI